MVWRCEHRLRWVMGCGCHPRRVCLVLAPSYSFHSLPVLKGGCPLVMKISTVWRLAERTLQGCFRRFACRTYCVRSWPKVTQQLATGSAGSGFSKNWTKLEVTPEEATVAQLGRENFLWTGMVHEF